MENEWKNKLLKKNNDILSFTQSLEFHGIESKEALTIMFKKVRGCIENQESFFQEIDKWGEKKMKFRELKSSKKTAWLDQTRKILVCWPWVFAE